TAAPAKPRKLSYREQQEWEGMESAILAAEEAAAEREAEGGRGGAARHEALGGGRRGPEEGPRGGGRRPAPWREAGGRRGSRRGDAAAGRGAALPRLEPFLAEDAHEHQVVVGAVAPDLGPLPPLLDEPAGAVGADGPLVDRVDAQPHLAVVQVSEGV